MAVKGKAYPYVGPGRELFLPGPPGSWYIPKALVGNLAWLDLSSADATPNWAIGPVDLEPNWAVPCVGFTDDTILPFWPFGASTQEISINYEFRPATPDQVVVVSFLSVEATGGPVPHVHTLTAVFPLRPQDYPGWFNLYQAVYKINNVVQAGNWVLNLNVVAVPWP